MNSDKDLEPDLDDTEAVDPDAEALQRSQDAIDEGRSAAQEALKDDPPDTADQAEQQEPEA